MLDGCDGEGVECGWFDECVVCDLVGVVGGWFEVGYYLCVGSEFVCVVYGVVCVEGD